MRIQCDACGAEVDSEAAVAEEFDDGEILWFCSEECRDTAVIEEADEEEVPAPPAAG